MLFFYLRHGDPIYEPNTLTVLGQKQAEALAKRLALYGIDRVFSSPSTRAVMTAQPTCDLLKKEMTLLDFCDEEIAWGELTIVNEARKSGKSWMFQKSQAKLLLTDPSVLQLSYRWYEHEALKQYNYQKGIERIYDEGDRFLLSLGYEHERYTGRYKVIRPNDERIALFAHQGFGLAFLSCLLDIPYPQFCVHFDMCHSGMTVIDFAEEEGYAIPRIMTLSSDAHLLREGLPTQYNGGPRF